MIQPGRKYEAGGGYRYGFNGKENDNEVKGEGSQQDYGMRIYDPRLGKFLSVDPLIDKYPMLSPYQFAGNMPIIAIDLDGAEQKILVYHHEDGTEMLRVPTSASASENVLLGMKGHYELHFYPVITKEGRRDWVQCGAATIFVRDGVNPQTGRLNINNASLGKLSEKFESQGVGTVSSGKGDAGGVSYGSWQLASKRGRPQEFLENEGKEWKSEFGESKPGSKAFSDTWKVIATKDPEGFKNAQHSFIKRTHYDVVANSIKTNLGLDVGTRSEVLQDVVWSTAVQHGPGNKIFQTALAGKDVNNLSDADIIKLVYAERGRKDSEGNLVHFSGNSKDVQKSVSNRFTSEQADALKKLGGN